jgi:hypothetical protein
MKMLVLSAEKTVLESFQEASASWEQVVFCAVEKSLLDLGPKVYSIEWAHKVAAANQAQNSAA